MDADFKGELQFAGYSDSSRNGPRVTFRLSDRDELVRFVGLEGRRFAAVLVELQEEQSAHNPPDESQAARPKGGPLCKLSAVLCQDASFRSWLSDAMPDIWLASQDRAGFDMDDEGIAADVVRTVCNVTSRAELDHDPAAKKLFDLLIRIPYMRRTA